MNSSGEIRPHSLVGPAQQRLARDHAAVGDRDDRLVVDLELVSLERVAQIALDAEPTIHLDAQVGVEDREAVAPDRLGAIHRNVGLMYQPVGGLFAILRD